MIYHDFLLNIAATLGDNRPGHEFERYSVDYLSRAAHQGLIIASKERPDLFTETAIIKLRAGAFQDAREEFDELFEVVAQCDADGCILRHLAGSRPTANTAKNTWTKAPCLVDQCDVGFTISSANIDTLAPGRFTVMPPVPTDCEAYVLARGMSNPQQLSIDDLQKDLHWDELLYAVVPYFVYATAALTDKDDAAHQRLMSTFYQMLQRAFDMKVNIQSSDRPDDVTARGNNRA